MTRRGLEFLWFLAVGLMTVTFCLFLGALVKQDGILLALSGEARNSFFFGDDYGNLRGQECAADR